ncbi:probable polygalacturonase [Tanacetum coccineum]
MEISVTEMGFLMLVFLSFCYVSFGPTTASAYVYDVTSFGAIGDGMKDDTKAFLQAWNSLCNDKSPYPTLHIPPGKTFLISPVAFNGPCKYSSVYIMSLTINGPTSLTGQGWICGETSIGSLGENGGNDTVEKVRVESCNITGTQNGLRIKTVPGGTGYARRILFQDIQLVDVKNPIIIEQHYCNNFEDATCPAPPNLPAVEVSDVTYTNIYGSSASKQAITFNCSGKYNCTGINTYNVGITGQDDFSYCKNAQGQFVSTTPNVICS